MLGSGHLPGQTAPDGITGTLCNFDLPMIPDSFYASGGISQESWMDHDVRLGKTVTSVTTAYTRNGRIVAVREIDTVDGGVTTQVFNDFTLVDQGRGGVLIQRSSNCKAGGSWTDPEPVVVPPDTLGSTGTPASAPASTSTSTSSTGPGSISTAVALTPVPFHTDTYFLRVDVTNTSAQQLTIPATVDLDLERYAMVDILAIPSDASCPSAAAADQLCRTGDLGAGQTESFLYEVQARPSYDPVAFLTVRTFEPGLIKVDSRNVPGLQITRASVGELVTALPPIG